jgi:hypothetical protein
MRITFDEVFTTARRTRQRRRSLAAAGGVAVAAVVAIMVPVAVNADTSSPTASPPQVVTDCDSRTPPAQAACVTNTFLKQALPDMTTALAFRIQGDPNFLTASRSPRPTADRPGSSRSS